MSNNQINVIICNLNHKFLQFRCQGQYRFKLSKEMQQRRTVSVAKKKIINEVIERTSKPLTQQANGILKKALADEYSMENHFKNLENPLQFLKNQRKQTIIHQTEDVSSKLQNQMTETIQLSKAIYKQVISNEDYLKFFKNKNDLVNEQHLEMNEIIKSQRRLKMKVRAAQNQTQGKLYNKKQDQDHHTSQNKKQKGQKNYRHATTQDKENIQENFNREIKFQHIKKLNTPAFDSQCKHIEFFNMLKSNRRQEPIHQGYEFNISSSYEVTKLTDKMKFPLIQRSYEFGEKSHDLFFDMNDFSPIWVKSPDCDYSFFTDKNQSRVSQKRSDEEILRNLVDFRSSAVNLTNVLDFGQGKITPKLLKDYFKLKEQHYIKIDRQKNDENLDEKYELLMKQYMQAQQRRIKDSSAKLPFRIVTTQMQTISDYQQRKSHKFFENFELVQDIIYKLGKLNKLRQKALRSYKKKQNGVILKNICLEIDQLLFKLILYMLKGQTFYEEKSLLDPNLITPFFTHTDLIKVENKKEVERKILQLIYTHPDDFKVQKVDGVTKKNIISVYVDQREKNNKVLNILDSKKQTK